MSIDNLNKEQLEAARCVEGPVMVFAGAGTGKTKTLTSRIIYMIEECHIDPTNILAITFTKKATNEMRDRIYKELSNTAYQIYISTIHSMCSRILRREIDKMGYKKDFEIIDDEEAQKVLSDIYKEEGIDRKVSPIKKALKLIGDYKNNGTKLYGPYPAIYKRYQEVLFENNMLDFDDLLIVTDDLFYKYPEVLEKYQELHKYILVDEFQDTNEIQYSIIKRLASKYNNVFVVGDDDQSIYSFRGATSKNMRSFMKYYPNCKKIILNQNYRSSEVILKGANSLISHNFIREPKELYSTTLGHQSDVVIKECFNHEDEARFVSMEIAKLISKGYSPEDICVLYRNGALSLNFEKSLTEKRISYRIYGGFSYLKRKEIKDIMSFFRFIIDDTKVIHFRRIINLPSRGIGDKTIERICDLLPDVNYSMLNAIEEYCQNNDSNKINNLLDFKELILDLRDDLSENISLPEFFDIFLEKTGYLEYVRENQEDEEHRDSNVLEFKSLLVKFEEDFDGVELSGYDKLQIVFDQILLDDSLSETTTGPSVTLSTVHSIKGLEFKVVFVVALEDGIFPSIREDSDIEEERRVCYVAVTRPIEKIYLSYCRSRLLYGRVIRNARSRFINEYLVNNEIKETTSVANPTEIKKATGEITVASKIHHSTYGYGTVVSVDDTMVQVVFDSDGSIRKFIKNTSKITKCEE